MGNSAQAGLRIATINTAKGDGPYWRRLDLLAIGLSRVNPDVVLLQESFASREDPAANTARHLGEALGLCVQYAPARIKLREFEGDRQVMSESGMAILSRQPLKDYCALPLPSDLADGPRVAQLATIAVNGVDVLLVNLHLTFLRGRDDLRRKQMASILNHHRPQESALTLLAGDFNTDITDLPRLFEDCREWHVQDGYTLGGGDSLRTTCPTSRPPDQGRCLDFILSCKRSGSETARFSDSAVILDEPDGDGVYPSDHRGVLTTLTVEATAHD